MPTTKGLWGAWALVCAAAAVSTAMAQETIGPYHIVATPASAALISGGGAAFNWLNVVNAPVSINDAFTGFSVIDDGYNNAASGTTLRLTFAPGTLRNRPGPDLVLFDADNNLNVYLVSTDRDNFTHQIAASAVTDTGITRSYYYGGQGPTSYAVMAGTIDLSSLDVSDGEEVTQVQLFTEGPSNDPLGLGVLAPDPVPALSMWGIAAAILLVLSAGSGFLLRRTRAADLVAG